MKCYFGWNLFGRKTDSFRANSLSNDWHGMGMVTLDIVQHCFWFLVQPADRAVLFLRTYLDFACRCLSCHEYPPSFWFLLHSCCVAWRRDTLCCLAAFRCQWRTTTWSCTKLVKMGLRQGSIPFRSRLVSSATQSWHNDLQTRAIPGDKGMKKMHLRVFLFKIYISEFLGLWKTGSPLPPGLPFLLITKAGLDLDKNDGHT